VVLPGLQLAYEGGPGDGFETERRAVRDLAVTNGDDGPLEPVGHLHAVAALLIAVAAPAPGGAAAVVGCFGQDFVETCGQPVLVLEGEEQIVGRAVRGEVLSERAMFLSSVATRRANREELKTSESSSVSSSM
jgi:hypothetical protein